MSSTQAPVRRSSIKYEMISSSSVVIVSPSVDSSAGGQLNETIPEIGELASVEWECDICFYLVLWVDELLDIHCTSLSWRMTVALVL